MEIKHTFCTMCPHHWCGLKVSVDNNTIIKVEKDEDNPISHGHVCAKGLISKEYLSHPNRLNFPLKRKGKRGEGKWEQISWEKALDEIASKMLAIKQQYGPEAVATFAGTVHGHGDWTAWRWANLWGTPNTFAQGKNCGTGDIIAECATYGYDTMTYSNPIPSITKTYVMWGFNPSESAPMAWKGVLRAKENGAKLIVIDPRETKAAKIADIWLQVRPGTDGALALGMINVIIQENLYDQEFVRDWCLGFDELKEIASDYSPEYTSQITGVPQEKITAAARMYATQKPGVLSAGVAVNHMGGAGAGKSAVQGKVILRAITGNLDVKGGNVLGQGCDRIALNDTVGWDGIVNHPERTRDCVSADIFPLNSIKSYSMFRKAMEKVYPQGYSASHYFTFFSHAVFCNAITEGKPYPIKAVIMHGGNPLLSVSNGRKIYEALIDPKLELSVNLELFMTPTAQLADYVLPVADIFERPDLAIRWGLSHFYFCAEQCVQPKFERKPDYYFWKELGNRVGQQGLWPDRLEGLLDMVLKPTGKTYEEHLALDLSQRGYATKSRYKKYLEKGFATKSGKVELLPSIFADLDCDPAPNFSQPESFSKTPELAKDYPLIMISGARVPNFCDTKLMEVEAMRKQRPDPLVEINPLTAEKLGIQEGDWVWIERPQGRIKQRAKLTNISPDVVSLDGYWWFPEKEAADPILYGAWESNANAITPDDLEYLDYVGQYYTSGPLCKVYKVES